jgi:hypothetical protein
MNEMNIEDQPLNLCFGEELVVAAALTVNCFIETGGRRKEIITELSVAS